MTSTNRDQIANIANREKESSTPIFNVIQSM